MKPFRPFRTDDPDVLLPVLAIVAVLAIVWAVLWSVT